MVFKTGRASECPVLPAALSVVPRIWFCFGLQKRCSMNEKSLVWNPNIAVSTEEDLTV